MSEIESGQEVTVLPSTTAGAAATATVVGPTEWPHLVRVHFADGTERDVPKARLV